jgi:hypothetical protein
MDCKASELRKRLVVWASTVIFGSTLVVVVGSLGVGYPDPIGPPVAAITVHPSGGNDTELLKCLIESPCAADLERRCRRLHGRPRPQEAGPVGRCGAIRFGPGVFKINQPIFLKGSRSYLGEGSFLSTYGSTIEQTSPEFPIFVVDGIVEGVVIAGLTFTGYAAKAIAAGDLSSSLLAHSSIRDNHFLADLKECIAVPMQGTVVAQNKFGLNGPERLSERHRHIYSAGLDPSRNPSNHNWIMNNHFSSARCTAEECGQASGSVEFERGVSLHLVGNRWESNQTLYTISLRGMFNVEIKGNYFEGNTGDALIVLAQDTVGPPNDRQANYIVRTEANYYNVAKNKFIFRRHAADQGTHIYMGFEAGTNFGATEIINQDAFEQCALRLTGPSHLVKYVGKQLDPFPDDLACPALEFPR